MYSDGWSLTLVDVFNAQLMCSHVAHLSVYVQVVKNLCILEIYNVTY